MLDKYKNICLIDNVWIESEHGRAIHKLNIYLKHHYKMSLEDYVLKFYYGNKKPTCQCGCGKEVSFSKGRFCKYYENHKNNVPISNDIKTKILENRLKRNTLNHRLERLNFTVQDLKNLYDKFVNFEINFSDIEKIYAVDKRTLKKYWYELYFIKNKEEFNRICKRHKYYWTNKNDSHKKKINEDVLYEIYTFIKKNPNKYTINEIKNHFDIKNTTLVLYKRLIEFFNKKEIDELLKLGLSSKPEVEFYNVLKFYYGNNVQKNFILENKHYDYIIGNKILIEYDGDYWHSREHNIINDKIKDEIAHKYDYIIFRIKDSESKNIEILNKLNILYNKIIK